MATIDDRIVSISFDNAKFEAGVAKTLLTLTKLNDNLKKVGTESGFENLEKSASKVTLAAPMSALDKLKAKLHFGESGRAFGSLEAESDKVTLSGATTAVDSLKAKIAFPEAGKAFSDIEASSSRVTLSPITSAVDQVTAKFGAMQVAAVSAIATIASKATMGGTAFAKGMTVDPIKQGFDEYGLKLSSVQTIMAATGKGTKPVNAALNELNEYSDKTIYSFKDMIENIPKFTNAGVPLEKSVKSIQGIAQVAAVSGATTNEAARAMYNFGQALGQGSVKLIDWKSIELANMGTVEFKQQLIDTAVAMGTLTKTGDGMYKTQKGTAVTTKNFSTTLADQWLTAEALTGTLEKYTDETSALGKKAFRSATDIKTLSQLIGVFKEQIGSGWAQSFEAIFGNLDEAKKLWGGVNDAIGGVIGKSAEARNAILKDWAKFGGRKALIEGIGNAFKAIVSVLTPLKEAFREIFPRKTGAELAGITKSFASFAERLKIGPETADRLKRTFAGFFAVLSIGKQIIGGILGVFGRLVGVASTGSGGILSFTGSIGDFIVAIDEALKKGEGLKNFFSSLGDVLAAPVRLLAGLANALGGFGESNNLIEQQQDLLKGLTPLEKALRSVTNAWEGFVNILRNAQEALAPILGQIREVFSGISGTIGEAFENMDFEKVFNVIQTGLIGGIFLVIKKALGGGLNIDLGGGLLDKMRGVLDGLTGSLKTMQQSIKAGILLKIASAIAILAAGIYVISTIDAKKLAKSMAAIAVGLGQLIAAVALLSTIGGGVASMAGMAASLILIAVAIDVLAIAIFAFSRLSWEELIKGLAGVGGALIALGIGVRAIPPGMAITAATLIPLAVALNILAVAVKVFATMDWADLSKGLLGMAYALMVVSRSTALIGPQIILIGPGLIAIAVAMNLLALALKAFGSMDLVTMGKGLAGMAAALGILGAAIWMFPPTMAAQAAGLVILSVALTGIAGAIALMGGMKFSTLAKGLTALGIALRVLGVGLLMMSGTLMGAAALMAAAAALAILVPVIGILGTMKLTTIVKGLAAMAGAIYVLGVAGMIAGPGLFVLGKGIAALGAGLLVVSAAVYLFSAGLALLGEMGPKGVTAVSLALVALVAILPKVVISFLKGLVEIVASMAALAPKIVDSMVKILASLIDVVIKSAPKLVEAVGVLIGAFLMVLDENVPNFIVTGFKILMAFLSGLKANVAQIVGVGTDIVVRFLGALTSSLPRLILAGGNLIVGFLRGVTQAIPRIVTAAVSLVTRFLVELTANMHRLASAGAGLVTSFLLGVANNIGRVIAAGGRLIRKFIQGVSDESGRIAGAAVTAMGKFIQACANAMLKLTNKIANVIVNFLNGLATAIRTHAPRIGRAGRNVASAIIDGLWAGLKELFGKGILDKIGWLINLIPKKIRKILGIKSPSSVFHEIGKHTMQGLSNGLGANAPAVLKAVESTADSIVSAMDKTLKIPNILDDLVVTDPVITPVLDLTDVKKGANTISDLSNVVPIVAAASYGQASAISADQVAAQEAAAAAGAIATVQEIKFEQHNHSPESLSDVEIYRKTNNQLSQAKSMLGVA